MFNFFIAFRYIRGRAGKLLSVNARLSFLGVFLGSALLVVVLSIFNGFQQQLKKSIFQFDPHLVIENAGGAGRIERYRQQLEAIRQMFPGQLSSAEAMIQSPAILRKDNNIEHVFLRGQDFAPTSGGELLPDYFPEITEPAGLRTLPAGNFCLVGHEMAANYGLVPGDQIEIIVPKGQFTLKTGVLPSLQIYTIAGFFKTGHYQYDSRVVVLSLASAQKLFQIGDETRQLVLRLNNPGELAMVKQKLFDFLPFSYRVHTIEDEQRNFFAALRLEKTIMTTIVFLFIVVAMVGILVSTFNVVRSRRRDIGILQALGVSKIDIMLVFMTSGFVMGTLGALAGIMSGIYLSLNLEHILTGLEQLINAVGQLYASSQGLFWSQVQLIPRDVYYFDHLPIAIDQAFLHTIGVLSVFLAGVAAAVPAWAASRLEPVEIIRGADN